MGGGTWRQLARPRRPASAQPVARGRALCALGPASRGVMYALVGLLALRVALLGRARPLTASREDGRRRALRAASARSWVGLRALGSSPGPARRKPRGRGGRERVEADRAPARGSSTGRSSSRRPDRARRRRGRRQNKRTRRRRTCSTSRPAAPGRGARARLRRRRPSTSTAASRAVPREAEAAEMSETEDKAYTVIGSRLRRPRRGLRPSSLPSSGRRTSTTRRRRSDFDGALTEIAQASTVPFLLGQSLRACSPSAPTAFVEGAVPRAVHDLARAR